MSDHNGYFGLSGARIAPVIDETNLVYGTPVDIGELGGIIEIAMNAQVSTDPVYATDRVWIDSQTDNGFEGNIRLINVWGEPTLRAAFAPLTGYEFATDGTLLGTSDKAPQKFALMGESSGNLANKRTCFLMCQLGKPNKGGQTKEQSGTNKPDEFSIVARPVTLPSGWKGSFYENVPEDGALYTNFMSGVRTDMVPESASGANTALAALTLGTAALTPVFSPNTDTYAVSTTSSTIPVTAVAMDSDATIAIKNGETSVTNGSTASLSSGENTITVTVTNGTVTKTYTVIVTKS